MNITFYITSQTIIIERYPVHFAVHGGQGSVSSNAIGKRFYFSSSISLQEWPISYDDTALCRYPPESEFRSLVAAVCRAPSMLNTWVTWQTSCGNRQLRGITSPRPSSLKRLSAGGHIKVGRVRECSLVLFLCGCGPLSRRFCPQRCFKAGWGWGILVNDVYRLGCGHQGI